MPHLMSIQMMARLPTYGQQRRGSNDNHKPQVIMAKLVPIKAKNQGTRKHISISIRRATKSVLSKHQNQVNQYHLLRHVNMQLMHH